MGNEFWKNSPFKEDSIFHPSWDKKQKERKLKNYKGVKIIQMDAVPNYTLLSINPVAFPFSLSKPKKIIISSDNKYVIVAVKVVVNLNGRADKVEVSLNKNTSITASRSNTSNFQYIANFNVKVGRSFARIDQYNSQEFIFTAKVKDVFTKEISDTMSVKTQIDTKGKLSQSKKIECFCKKDFQVSDVKKIIYELRKSETNESLPIKTKLFNAINCPLAKEDKTIEKFTKQLNATFLKYNITKCIHKIHFLAQVYHETDRFKTTLEYFTIKDYKPYFGRGLMQITHEINYKIYSYFYSKYSGIESDFVTNYDILANNLYHVFNSAGWLWNQGKMLTKGDVWKPNNRAPSWLKKGNPVFQKKEISYTLSNGNKLVYGTINFNQIAEKDMVDVISYLVNGGNNGLYERRKYVDILKTIFNYENCTNN